MKKDTKKPSKRSVTKSKKNEVLPIELKVGQKWKDPSIKGVTRTINMITPKGRVYFEVIQSDSYVYGYLNSTIRAFLIWIKFKKAELIEEPQEQICTEPQPEDLLKNKTIELKKGQLWLSKKTGFTRNIVTEVDENNFFVSSKKNGGVYSTETKSELLDWIKESDAELIKEPQPEDSQPKNTPIKLKENQLWESKKTGIKRFIIMGQPENKFIFNESLSNGYGCICGPETEDEFFEWIKECEAELIEEYQPEDFKTKIKYIELKNGQVWKSKKTGVQKTIINLLNHTLLSANITPYGNESIYEPTTEDEFSEWIKESEAELVIELKKGQVWKCNTWENSIRHIISISGQKIELEYSSPGKKLVLVGICTIKDFYDWINHNGGKLYNEQSNIKMFDLKIGQKWFSEKTGITRLIVLLKEFKVIFNELLSNCTIGTYKVNNENKFFDWIKENEAEAKVIEEPSEEQPYDEIIKEHQVWMSKKDSHIRYIHKVSNDSVIYTAVPYSKTIKIGDNQCSIDDFYSWIEDTEAKLLDKNDNLYIWTKENISKLIEKEIKDGTCSKPLPEEEEEEDGAEDKADVELNKNFHKNHTIGSLYGKLKFRKYKPSLLDSDTIFPIEKLIFIVLSNFMDKRVENINEEIRFQYQKLGEVAFKNFESGNYLLDYETFKVIGQIQVSQRVSKIINSLKEILEYPENLKANDTEHTIFDNLGNIKDKEKQDLIVKSINELIEDF